ncbi:hypothetical protein, partial [Sinorhizobium medicae]|uniref:hypothetical protein n=1 Tax=Sinorhizobium medicae TaxID=110321 RepID=UPI001F446B69
MPKNFRRIFRTSFVCHISRLTSAPIMVVAAPPSQALTSSIRDEYFCDTPQGNSSLNHVQGTQRSGLGGKSFGERSPPVGRTAIAFRTDEPWLPRRCAAPLWVLKSFRDILLDIFTVNPFLAIICARTVPLLYNSTMNSFINFANVRQQWWKNCTCCIHRGSSHKSKGNTYGSHQRH